jgi:UDP-N-acetylmuramoylalanine--D-glutamate ligase
MILEKFFRHLKGKRVVVMGLGLHGGGVATTKWLIRHGARVCVTDVRKRSVLRPSIKKIPKTPRCTYVLGEHRHEDFRHAACIVANPGVPRTSPYLNTARKHGIPIVNEATIFFLFCPCPIVGITGTKGKSTVSALVWRFLKKKYRKVILAGNIRTTAMLDVLDALTARSLVVLELSSWQLEGLSCIRKSPHVSLITNYLDDHLNQYPSRQAYFSAKDIIWKYQTPRDVVVLNKDNAPLRARGRRVVSRRYWFSLAPFTEENGSYAKKNELRFRENGSDEVVCKVGNLRIQSSHAIANVLAAIAIARIFRVPKQHIKSVLRSFRGIEGRLETVRTIRGVTYINDTAATAPVATIAALESFKHKVICIVGGVDKKLPYGPLAHALKRRAKAIILLPGTASDKLCVLLKGTKVVPVSSMRDAVLHAASIAHEGDVVLLSPGAASFNLFLHEFDRGDAFVRIVRSLPR